MESIICRDEAVARFAAFLDQQIASGRQGERHVAFSLDHAMRITTLKAIDSPHRYKRLPASAAQTLAAATKQ